MSPVLPAARLIALTVCVVLLGQTGTALAQHDLQGGIQDLVRQMVASMEQQQKRKLAVLDFTKLDGTVDNFGRHLAEQLISEMFLTRRFEVIERRQLDKILSELKLNLSDLVDPENAKRLGKIYGVDAIATGSVTELASTLAVNSRLIETETGRVFSVASTRFTKDRDVLSLLGGPSAAPARRTPGRPADSIESGGLSFRSKSCERERDSRHPGLAAVNDRGGLYGRRANFVCTIAILSPTAERSIAIIGDRASTERRTRLIDDLGNSYPVAIVIGHRAGTEVTSIRLYPNTPVNVHFVSIDVNRMASSMTLVIAVEDFHETVILKDLPIDR